MGADGDLEELHGHRTVRNGTTPEHSGAVAAAGWPNPP
jgi:hypothetical protein